MIEQLLNVMDPAISAAQPMLAQPMLAQAGGESQFQDLWAPLNTALKALVIGACSLGLTIGVIYKLTENDDTEKETWTNVVMGASITGLVIALLAVPIANAFINAT